MNKVIVAGLVLAAAAGAIYVSNRLSVHKTPFGSVQARINTRVHRVNQP